MRLALLLLFPLGCITSGDDKPGDDTAGGDADTDTDTDTDVDLGPCPTYSGIHTQGQTWEWAYTDEAAAEYGAASWTTTLTSFSGGDWTVHTEGTYEYEGLEDYTSNSVSTGYCDTDGMWAENVVTDTHYVLMGTAYDTESTITYDAPVLTFPAGIAEGSSWTVSYSGTTTTTGVPDNTFAYDVDYSVVGTATIDVPAGSFETLEVEGQNDGNTFSYWTHRTVGSVANQNSELQSYE